MKKKAMSIKNKLLAIVAGLVALVIVTCIFSAYDSNRIAVTYTKIIDQDVRYEVNCYAAARFMNASHCEMLRALHQIDYSERQKALAQMESFDKSADEYLAKLVAASHTEEAKNLIKLIQNDVVQYRQARNVALQPTAEGNVNLQAVQRAEDWVDSFRNHNTKMFQYADRSFLKNVEDLGDYNALVNMVMVAVVTVLIVIAAVLSIRIANNIADRIRKISGVAARIADGDLSVPFVDDNMDELGVAAEGFEQMRNNMRLTIADINHSAEQVASGAKNISDASISLSQGATEQAASIEELSASISAVTTETVSNANDAAKAAELSDAARNAAAEGDQSMQRMLDAMEAINESSTNISKIIKVIDEIAFQTNILALNAAVEAARAGQHGKGFAVVAEEVRNLAARSAKAAKETTDMIEGSIARVADGREIAKKTAESLNAIVHNVTETAGLIDSIADSSNNQKGALSQINEGVLQVSKVVEANSAASQQSAAASESLSHDAGYMKSLANKFRLGMDANDLVGRSAMAAAPKAAKPQAGKDDAPMIALTDEELSKQSH